MRKMSIRSIGILLFLLVFTCAAAAALPNPVIYLSRADPYESGGKLWIHYNYLIDNAEAFPAELWTPSPALPPCGTNNRASRTWIDIYDQSGRRLYGFCGLNSTTFSHVWFNLEADVVPPSWIYIEMTDRQTNTKYKSNLAETTL